LEHFADKVIVITGGANGIGFATAAYFLERGAKVAIADVDAVSLGRAIAAFEPYMNSFLAIHETVATWEGAQRIVDQVAARFGTLHVLINNAAKTRDNLLLRMTVEEFEDVMGTNLYGAFYCAKAAVPHMISNQGGRIINLIAASGLAGNPGQTNYAASKGGILAMTLTWSKELAKHHINVNSVIPAAWTGMSERIPEAVLLKVLGEKKMKQMQARKPSQVAPLLGYLASDSSKAVTGQCLSIAGQRLSVWQYGKPSVGFEAASGLWALDAIHEQLSGGTYWQQPSDPIM
jgi:3-oxoacyl-[acyl-carrier protein] reductase